MTLPLVVPGRPADTGLAFWVLGADGSAIQPALTPAPAGLRTVVHSLRRRNDDLGELGVFLVACTGLAPDSTYRLDVTTAAGATGSAVSRTLPTSLQPGVPFTIALGSCYCQGTDKREIERFFPPPLHTGAEGDPIRLRFMLGDQVYMDLKTTDVASLPLSGPPNPWRRYTEQWTSGPFARFLAKSPSVFIADDHEGWNDFPHHKVWLPWSEHGGSGAQGQAVVAAFKIFQASLNLHPASVTDDVATMDRLLSDEALTFQIDVGPLSFFVLDTRLNRTVADARPSRFSAPEHLAALERCLSQPGGPVILALGPTFVAESKVPDRWFDKGLVDYPDDYVRLGNALLGALRPVLILAGDIHYSRLYAISPFPRFSGASVFELTSSAFARVLPPARVIAGMLEPDIPHQQTGTLELVPGYWQNLRLDDSGDERFVTVERQTFATVTFTPQGSDASAPVRAIVRAWAPPPDRAGAAAKLLLQKTLTLTGAAE